MINKTTPIIGISGSIIVEEGGDFPGFERAYVNDDYIQSVADLGAIPMILPLVYDDEIIKLQVESIDALILSGGHDVNPLLWQEQPHTKLQAILPKRDTFDMKLLEYALELKKPILGICRGEQVINVYAGGNLYQDLSLSKNSYIKHNQVHLPYAPTHNIEIIQNTKLYDILKEDSIVVNSFHHMAVKEVAPGYIVSAISKDGIVEGIEKEGEDFVLGVQWHPEMMRKDSGMKKIFKALINEARKISFC